MIKHQLPKLALYQAELRPVAAKLAGSLENGNQAHRANQGQTEPFAAKPSRNAPEAPSLDVPSSARSGGNRLPVLVGEIASAHSACRKATRTAVRHAVEAGRRLIEAKELVPHGCWLPWLAESLPDISIRTAQRYMRAAEAAGRNDTVSLFTLRALLKKARKPSRDVGQHGGAVRKMNRRMAESIVAIANELARVRARMSPELWPLWLEAEFRWSPEVASHLVSAAADIEQGRSFDVAGVTHALASLQGGGRP